MTEFLQQKFISFRILFMLTGHCDADSAYSISIYLKYNLQISDFFLAPGFYEETTLNK